MTDESTEIDQGNSTNTGGSGETGTWFLAEGVPGSGERPDFLDKRYKTLSDQARAYTELNKRFSMLSGAPDEYDLGEAKEMGEAAPIKELLDYFKANKISQEGASKVLGAIKQYQDGQVKNPEDILAELGPNGQSQIETLARWAENNLSPERLQAFKKMANSAENIRMFDDIRKASVGGTSQPPHGGSMTEALPAESFEDVKLEMIEAMKTPDYNSNKLLRKRLMARLEAARIREGMPE